MTEQIPAENDPFAGFDEQTKRKLAKDLAMGHHEASWVSFRGQTVAGAVVVG